MGKWLVKLFPMLNDIQSAELREQATRAVELAVEQGAWTEETLLLVPVNVSKGNCDVGLVEHVNDVAAMAMAGYGLMEKYYHRHNVVFDRDTVLCGALLHDLGKLSEFTMQDGKPAHREGYELMRHPLSGAILAAKAGLPDKIAHLIATHSFEGERSYQTAESDYVRAIDQLVYQGSMKGL